MGVSATDSSFTMSRFFAVQPAPDYIRSQRLYERKPVTELWNKLTTVAKQQWKWKNVPNKENPGWSVHEKRLLQVRGPPGCGKSSATFRWILSTCEVLRSVKALWIDTSDEGGGCWSFGFDQAHGKVDVASSAVPLSAQYVDDTHIVVFDGIRKDTLKKWRNLMIDMARTGIFAVAVSSEGARFHEGNANDIEHLDHFFPSWITEEYQQACSDNKFWATRYSFFDNATENDSVARRNELLEEKFKLAGHSARFMFNRRQRKLENDLSELAKTMGGIDSLEEAIKADRSTGAVNSLVARLDPAMNGTTPKQQAVMPAPEDLAAVATTLQDLLPTNAEYERPNSIPRIVSAQATAEILNVIPSDIKRLRDLARSTENRAIEGYALEQQLKKKLTEGSQNGRALCLVINGQFTSLPVSRVLHCSTKDNVQNLLKPPQPDNTWIFIAGRQGAFDAVHILSHTHIRFVQVTACGSHTFKLHVLDSLMTSLALQGRTWSHLEFMVVRPSDDARPFALGTTQGTLKNYSRFDNQPWNRQDYRDNVQYATLDWD